MTRKQLKSNNQKSKIQKAPRKKMSKTVAQIRKTLKNNNRKSLRDSPQNFPPKRLQNLLHSNSK